MNTSIEQLVQENQALRKRVDELESKMDIVMGELLLLKQSSPQNKKRKI